MNHQTRAVLFARREPRPGLPSEKKWETEGPSTREDRRRRNGGRPHLIGRSPGRPGRLKFNTHHIIIYNYILLHRHCYLVGRSPGRPGRLKFNTHHIIMYNYISCTGIAIHRRLLAWSSRSSKIHKIQY